MLALWFLSGLGRSRNHRRSSEGSLVAQPLTAKSSSSNADLLLRLTLQILVGTESKSAAEEDDGVEADAGRGAVGGLGGCGGLCVALGLGVALLCSLSVHVELPVSVAERMLLRNRSELLPSFSADV